MDDVEEAHDVGVVHFLEKRDLANGSGGNAFIFGFQSNLLEGDDALVFGGEVARLVDNSVSSWFDVSKGA